MSRPEKPESPKRPPKKEAMPQPEWLSFLEQEEWDAFCEVIVLARQAGIESLLGGALGLAAYMPLRRRTKDLDFYVRPSARESFVAMLKRAGFRDFYDQLPYDRAWIYRGLRGEVLVDVIWSFANQRAVVDEEWFEKSHTIQCEGYSLRIVPPEELIRSKLFVLQRERCDWPDILNLLYYAGPTLKWEWLRARLGPDQPLLDAAITLFHWLCPNRSLTSATGAAPLTPYEKQRAVLLDSRDWFLPCFS